VVFGFFALRYALGFALRGYPFLLFFPGIIICAAAFGFGAGAFATCMSAILALYYFMNPAGSAGLITPIEAIAIGVFIAVALFTAFTVDALYRASEQLRNTRKALADRVLLLDSMTEGLPEPIFVKDARGLYVHANSAVTQFFGRTKEEVIGHSDRDFVGPDEAAALERADQQVMSSRAAIVAEEKITPAGDNRQHTYLSTKAPWISDDGRVIGVFGIARNIDQRKSMEDELRSAVELKRVLLFDINHRMKNHLQSIASLLMMAQRDTNDDSARTALTASAGRVSVLARVYERLHLNEQLDSVKACDFIDALGQELRSALIGDRNIELRTRCDNDLVLNGECAVVVGLLINELVTNALKYAFPDRAGHVLVSLTAEGEKCRLEVRDDGVGPSQDKFPRRIGSGDRLIMLLAEQLQGELHREGPPGTCVVLRFTQSTERVIAPAV
jgi:PAS domain S-box-containing protein